MDIIQKFRDLIFGVKKRKLEREKLQKFIKLQVIIDGNRYAINDVSAEGFALINEGKSVFELEKIYSCNITLRGEPRLTIKIKAIRLAEKTVGFEVMDSEIFNRFINSNLKL